MSERETATRGVRERSKTPPRARPVAFDDLSILLPDWRRHLRATNKAPLTIDSYLAAGNGLLDFLRGTGMPTAVHDLTREHIELYLVSMQDRRLSPATVAKHYRSLQQLFRWLVEDGELDRSPFERMPPCRSNRSRCSPRTSWATLLQPARA
ncbi:site-specific integrase, partial [Nocardioides sp.]|uniref:site-specific integrase n=1 Tax=Nocardioides sp. TaxID=35761 RepID=UPI002F412704